MKLVDDWKHAWKWASTRFMALAMLVQASWVELPDDLRASVPHGLVSGITIGLLALGIGGRITTKGSDDAPPAA